ncbi:MAG: 30S ribosomal protein S6 [Desulfobacteraceae bacterium 4572_19]|nr:MAG: 30S ribosomal protein S6 [Desulfobacteraceae bacterium 4572_19]
MRRYETIFIADPDIPEERRSQIFDKIKDTVKVQNGFIAEFDEWGIKKLAYEINRKPRGYYVRMDLCGTGDLIFELERNFRLDDKVLKFMTILLESNTSIEKIKQEIADKAKSKEEKDALESEKRTAQTEDLSDSDEVESSEAKPDEATLDEVKENEAETDSTDTNIDKTETETIGEKEEQK